MKCLVATVSDRLFRNEEVNEILTVTFSTYKSRKYQNLPFKRWIKSYLLFAGIIRSSPFSRR